MQPALAVLVFCDLDDTLFESRFVQLEAAAALPRFDRACIPIVFSSTKTRAEMELFQQESRTTHPFICENGAAVFVPAGYFDFSVAEARALGDSGLVEFGKPYADVVASLQRAAERTSVEVVGFNDMSVEEVAVDRDLPLLQARLAKLREYSEPFRVVTATPGALRRLSRALRTEGVGCTSRGRYHYAGADRCTMSAQFLADLYRRAFGEMVTVAFADHRSAAPLLRLVDIPIVVPAGEPDETLRLLAEVPAAHLTVVGSVAAWADTILAIASTARSQ